MTLRTSLFVIAALLATGSTGMAETMRQQTPDAPRGDHGKMEVRMVSQAQQTPAQFRRAVTEGIQTGSVLRAEAVAAATPGPRVGGYLATAGSERPLRSDQLAELIALIRAEGAFDDSIVKRCEPGTSVGFRLSGNAGTVLDVVLDFGCDRLLLVDSGGDESATDFGPSRGAFVAYVKRVLPADSEIQALD